MLIVFLLVLGLVVLWLGAALALDSWGRRVSPSGDVDAIVVLGCRVLADGSPSGHLARRVQKAVDLWRQGRAPIVVFSGGGKPSEAFVAARHAADLGLVPSAVVLEERSSTTTENARFSAELIRCKDVLVVTDSYHVVRAGRIFRRNFPEASVVGVVAPAGARFKNSLREVLALLWDSLSSSTQWWQSSPP
ncbi:MAG: YdcF family protein [Acidobacteriota bacterium]|nr:YdcF family protein [Acidobacteriota bacterium]